MNFSDIQQRNELAHKMIKDLCRPKHDPEHRDWIMSIPARENYDPDLVIGASLRDVPKLQAELTALRGFVRSQKVFYFEEYQGRYRMSLDDKIDFIITDRSDDVIAEGANALEALTKLWQIKE